MSLIANYFMLLFTFFKIGLFGFGGGYAMLSMIMAESTNLGITIQQFADLNALDMIVPGPIAINSATYVGYLNAGFIGAVFATVGVMLPSFIIVYIVIKFIDKYRNNTVMEGVLSGVKPAAVGLIAAAAVTIAAGIIIKPGYSAAMIFTQPLEAISFFLAAIFAAVAFLNIKFNTNPILLTLIAGVIGAIFVR